MDAIETIYDVSFQESSRDDLIALIKSMHGTIGWVREETERQCKARWESRVNEADRAKDEYNKRMKEIEGDNVYRVLVDENKTLSKRIAANQQDIELLSKGVLNSDYAFIGLKNKFEAYKFDVRYNMCPRSELDCLQREVERLKKIVSRQSKSLKQKTIKRAEDSKSIVISCDQHLL